ncbi:MAG: 4Fe-4S dicluster domain-containing protein [Actinobacteria bacterium]|nr:4Fe-4S dicluster domain-containing protein [Actinomycetota bacterium]
MSINVLLVDRDEGYRRRLTRSLTRASSLHVVGDIAPGLGVLAEAAGLEPDVILLHLDGPLDGQLDSCGPLTDLSPKPLVLVLGALGREDTERAERSGADAVVSPAVGSRSLARLVRVLASRRSEEQQTARVETSGPTSGVSRRRFLTEAAATGLGAAALIGLQAAKAKANDETVPTNTGLDLPADKDAILVRMQRDLQRALRKPIEERRWGMMIDLRKCIGCSACTVACVAENRLPPGVVYRPVSEVEVGSYPNVARQFLPRPCMQCDDPPCTDVCPVAATYKRPDGVVEIDYDKCIGCRYCIPACPYGARTFDWGENWTEGTPRAEAYELGPPPEYGESWGKRSGNRSPIGNVRKCHFCLHRLNAGMLPACTTTCVGAATYFGDLNDSEALMTQLIGSEHVERLREDKGTEPKVFYLR